MKELADKGGSLWNLTFKSGLYDRWLPGAFHASTYATFDALGDCERILDLGCGSGSVIPHAKPSLERGADLIGVDASKEGLAFARRRAQLLGVSDRVELIRGDMRDVGELGLSPVDGCMCHFALFTLSDLRERVAVMRQVQQLLVPGGRFALTVPGEGYSGSVLAAAARQVDAHDGAEPLLVRAARRWLLPPLIKHTTARIVEPNFDAGIFYRYGQNDLQRELRRAGFNEVTVTEVPSIGAYRAVATRVAQ